MTALIVVLAIALFLILLLSVNIRIRLLYSGELVGVLRVLFFKFRLFPEKAPKKSLTVKQLRRLEKKEEKKKQKKAAKKKKKGNSTTEKNVKKEKKKRTFSDIRELISEISEIALHFVKRFFPKLHVDIHKLNLTVATNDAAKTALTYGAVCQSVSYLIALLEENSKLKIKPRAIDVNTDYTKEKFDADIDIELYLRLGNIISLGFSTLTKYIKQQAKKGGK